MAALAVLAVVVAAAVYANAAPSQFQTGNPYFQVVRAPMTESEALQQNTDKLCTAIYVINLRPEYTTQGNDIGMLQPQGKNTSGFGNIDNGKVWADVSNKNSVGGDYTVYPYNASTIAAANEMFSVAPIYDQVTGTPIGFKLDVMRMYYSVCVQIRGVYNRWVEIMAQTPQPDRKICYEDWRPDTTGRPNLANNPFQKSCGLGNLYVCRSSPNENDNTQVYNYKDNMNVRFFCESCDDEVSTFYWRIVASQMPPTLKAGTTNTYLQPDASDWCLYRSGSDYPNTLLKPYPENYIAPAVFQQLTSSSMSLVVSAWLLGALAILALFLQRGCMATTTLYRYLG